MSVKIEADGRRSVEDLLDVAGTPDEVWQAIATGPGISAWFVPTDVEQCDGKAVAVQYHFGPGMDPRADVTAWDPPRTFRQEADGWFPGSPRMATEWTIQARAGGTCTVRIVHSLFASTDDWDDQLEGAKSGWSGFLATLRLYLAHFRGERGALAQLRHPASGTDAQMWDALTTALGLRDVRVGQRFAAPAGAPAFSGVVEYVSADPYDALLRIDAPAPGIVALGIAGVPGGGQSKVGMNLYLYGDQADATLAREAPRWEAWFAQTFPGSAEPALSVASGHGT
jgi:uncharacterized protein YndB with AHSA1/START domain